VGGPDKRTIHYLETLAGDTTIGHATAYCQAVEALAGREASLRAQMLRAVALELERLANHTGDLGALAVDVGYLPTSAFCGRLRGDFLNTTALLCGSRFGRSQVRPGGVAFDADQERSEQVLNRVDAAFQSVTGAVDLLWHSPSVMARFDGTGFVPRGVCDELGLVGLAARACGVDRDVRRDFPAGFFRFAQIPVSTWHTGDVFGRAYVRWQEVRRSARFVSEQMRALPRGDLRRELGPLRPEAMVVSLVEGWRGEICHVAITGGDGRFARYKVVDPSFRNWIGLAMALRNQQISDFPVCNKSFNLSYCGHDL
jgi:Ni,Fe-hydrogenase III large subunit